jgi:23S rRNA (pseudouridine1915-N3)-methyltransferase
VNIEIVKVGKAAHKEYEALIATFKQRLSSYAKVTDVRLKTLDLAKFHRPNQALIALDGRGTLMSSESIAESFGAMRDDPQVKTVTLVVGGPYGLDDDFLKLCAHKWSLSKCTFTSDLAWLILWEQVYRAFTILNGSPYHHA